MTDNDLMRTAGPVRRRLDTAFVRDAKGAPLACVYGVHPGALSDNCARSRTILVADAFDVFNETGLTPRQLAEQRNELLEALKRIIEMDDDAASAKGKLGANMNGYGLVDLFDIVNHPFGSGDHKQSPCRSVQLEVALTDARAVIAKAEGGAS